MLNWSRPFGILLFLDSNSYRRPYGRYECLLAAGAASAVTVDLQTLQEAWERDKDWLFGHIAYEYKDLLEPKLRSRHEARLGYPLLHFFRPETVMHVDPGGSTLTISCLTEDPHAVYEALNSCVLQQSAPLPGIGFAPRVDRETYLDTIGQIREHIAAGDCYELNYCSEGYAEGVDMDPVACFEALNALSAAPFAAFYRLRDLWMMSSSPERYLMKDGNAIRSQPIKGTARRSVLPEEDIAAKERLRSSLKEQAENVMITDLVRNDLARSCSTGSIRVEELFGIYSFPQVHQMISTVSGSLEPGRPFTDALRYSYPMGSMTGAPKVKVMELIDQYEKSRRELFSGTVGYITPDGDFDFNVVIRSLFYNSSIRYLSFHTGGAITYDSDPVQEWEEMRLKAWALEKIFHQA